jgi:ligand-binding sensor domain-containing protein/DNA-binding CsgD family transcriptional regulator
MVYPIYAIKEKTLEFDYLGVEDGLPQSSANDIIQDSYGYIWIGTEDGLAKYNNYKFEIFKKNNENGKTIHNNHVLKLFIDTKDNLWVGTRTSLELYNRDKDNFTHFYFLNIANTDTTELMVMEIMQENDSILWICTDGGSLFQFNINTKKKYSTEKYFSASMNFSKRASDFYIDNYGNYWIGTLDDGIYKFEPKLNKLSKIDLISLLNTAAIEIRDIIEYSHDTILVGTYGQGIFKINTRNNKVELYNTQKDLNTAPGNRIFKLINDKYNNIWIGTDGAGLWYDIRNQDNIVQYKHHGFDPKSINNDVIKSFLIDREGNIWTGHYLGGISIARKKNDFYGIKNNPIYDNSLSHNMVSSILIDCKNRLWIGTDGGGLNIMTNNKIYNNNNDNNNINELVKGDIPRNILAIFEDNNKNIWLGTYLDGVYIYNSEKNKISRFNDIYPDINIRGRDVRCFYQDRKNNIWIGTNGGGVNVFNPENKTIRNIARDSLQQKNTISLSWIRNIIEDNYGFIWIATAFGLNRYDPVNDNFYRYFYNPDDFSSISDDFILYIIEDSENSIWIGTSNGLNKYNRQSDSFVRYNVTDGLPNNIINAIIEDNNANLWLSTNAGISKFDKKNTFINFNVSDGLLSNSFVNGSVYKDKNNSLYFGSIHGLVYFNPDKIQEVNLQIPIVFTDFSILNQSVKIDEPYKGRVILTKHISNTREVFLTKKDYSITIEFAALSYAYPNKILYEYKLENFDKNWNILDGGHSVSYTNLKSGSYEFKVRSACLGPNQPITKLDIIIPPPFYETKWFNFLIAICVLLLLYYWNFKRIRKIQDQKNQLEKEYEETKYESEKERIKLKNEMLEVKMKQNEAEMNLRNSQLISSTLLITHKNEIMNEIKTEINSSLKNVVRPEVKIELSKLVKRIDAEFKIENEWGQFEEHFNQVHKDFFTRLKNQYPDLTLTYLKLSAYLRLDLTTKEIAALMNISQRGVEKSRSRLRKKLNVEEDINLVQFIAQI